MNPIYLNIGCDHDIRAGWINIDEFNIHPGVVKMNAMKLEFPDNSIDHITARDVLEHIAWRKTDEVLAEWYRVLKPGGTIYIQSPNLMGWALAIVHHKCSFHHAMEHIFAHQDSPGNFHYTGFTKQDITERLTKVGFKNIEHIDEDKKIYKTDDDTNVHCHAIK